MRTAANAVSDQAVLSKLADLGMDLPGPVAPSGRVRPFVQVGRVAYGSGTLAYVDGERRYLGRLGDDLSVEDGYLSARDACLVSLANFREAFGTFDRIERLARLTVYVRATPDFTDSPSVAHGASDLLVELFGEAGLHARSAIGVAALPGGHSVEVEIVAELTEL